MFETFDGYPITCQRFSPNMIGPSIYGSYVAEYGIETENGESIAPSNFSDGRDVVEQGKYFPRNSPWLLRCQNFPPFIMGNDYQTYQSTNSKVPENGSNLSSSDDSESKNSSALTLPSSAEIPSLRPLTQPFNQRVESFDAQTYAHPTNIQYRSVYNEGSTYRSITNAASSENMPQCSLAQANTQSHQRPLQPYPNYHQFELNSHLLEAEERMVYQNMTTYASCTEQKVIKSGDREYNIAGRHFIYENTSVCSARILQDRTIPPFSYIDQNNVGNPIDYGKNKAQTYNNSANDLNVAEIKTDLNECKDPKRVTTEQDQIGDMKSKNHRNGQISIKSAAKTEKTFENGLPDLKSEGKNELLIKTFDKLHIEKRCKDVITKQPEENPKDEHVENEEQGDNNEQLKEELAIAKIHDQAINSDSGLNETNLFTYPPYSHALAQSIPLNIDGYHGPNYFSNVSDMKESNDKLINVHDTNQHNPHPQVYRYASPNYIPLSQYKYKIDDTSVYPYEVSDVAHVNPVENHSDSEFVSYQYYPYPQSDHGLHTMLPMISGHPQGNPETFNQDNPAHVSAFKKHYPQHSYSKDNFDTNVNDTPGGDLVPIAQLEPYDFVNQQAHNLPQGHAYPTMLNMEFRAPELSSEGYEETNFNDTRNEYNMTSHEKGQHMSRKTYPNILSEDCLEGVMQKFHRVLAFNNTENLHCICKAPHCILCYQQVVNIQQMRRCQLTEFPNPCVDKNRMRHLKVPLGKIVLWTSSVGVFFRYCFVLIILPVEID